jgi:hypothetical protein
VSDPRDILTSRGLTSEVIEARGYVRYESADDVLGADPRMGSTKKLADWTKHYGARGPGWVMPKWKLPGSGFEDPLPQLRPDVPAPDYSAAVTHDHEKAFAGRPVARALHEGGKAHETIPVEGSHQHVPEGKYLIAPGTHGKRWDSNPLCVDRWAGGERVFLHLEGCIKADALTAVGEAAADVPSVTLWDRRGALSFADWPGGEPTKPQLRAGVGFWEAFEESEPELEKYDAEVERIREAQQDELVAFLTEHVSAPVIVVCDSDWRWNSAVAMEAFSLSDLVRQATDLHCVVAAPLPGTKGEKQGTDDFLAGGGSVANHLVIEPVESPDFADWARDYERRRRNAGGKRPRIEADIELMRWYATHASAEGAVERRAKSIARRLGVDREAVRRATLRLEKDGALDIHGYYSDPDDDGPREGRGHREPTLIIAERLRSESRSEPLGDWLKAQR